MIHRERVQRLNDESVRGGAYVLYWMQASQRTGFNHALEHAVERANELRLPVVVGFGLMDNYPASCRIRGMAFVVRRGSPPAVAAALAGDAALVVCDRGYLRHQKQ